MAKHNPDKYGPGKFGPNSSRTTIKTFQATISAPQGPNKEQNAELTSNSPVTQDEVPENTLQANSDVNVEKQSVQQDTVEKVVVVKLRDYPWNNLGPSSDMVNIRFFGRCKANFSPERVYVQPYAICREGIWYTVPEKIASTVFHHTGDVQSFVPVKTNPNNSWPNQPEEGEYGIWGIEFKRSLSDNPNHTNTLLSGKKVEPFMVHEINVPSSEVEALREAVFECSTKKFATDDRQLYLTADHVLFGMSNGRKVKTELEAATSFHIYKSDKLFEARGILFLVEHPEVCGELDLRTKGEKFKEAFKSFKDLDKKLTKAQLQTLIDSINTIESNDPSGYKNLLLADLEKVLECFESVDELVDAFSKLPRFQKDYKALLAEKLEEESAELQQIKAEKSGLEKDKENLTTEVRKTTQEVAEAKRKSKTELEKIQRNYDSRSESMRQAFEKAIGELLSNTDKALGDALEFKLFYDILTAGRNIDTATSNHSLASGTEIKVVNQDNQQDICQLLEPVKERNVLGRRLLGGRYEQLVKCINFLGECGVSVILRGKGASPIARTVWADKKRVVAKCPYALNRDITSELLLDGVTNFVIMNANLSPVDVYLEEFVFRYLEQMDNSDGRLQALFTFSSSPLALQDESLISPISVTIDLDKDWNKPISDEDFMPNLEEAVDDKDNMRAFLTGFYPELNSWSIGRICDYLFDDDNISGEYKEVLEDTKNLIMPFIYGKVLSVE